MTNKYYGWRRDNPDFRDYQYKKVKKTGNLASDLRSKCPPIWNQGNLGSCHDDVTEVLTLGGWKLFKNIDVEDLLATVDPETSQLIFEAPTRLIAFPYNGDMIYGKHQSIDFAVTPDHIMILRKWKENERSLASEYSKVLAKDIGWYAGLATTCNYCGEINTDTITLKGVEHKNKPQRSDRNISMTAWLRFLGIYLAEGTMLKSYVYLRSNQNKDGSISTAVKGANKVQIAAGTEAKRIFIRQVLSDIGVNALELKDRFVFSNKQVYSAMKVLGLEGIKAPQKFVPEFIFKLSSVQIREFLLGHFVGDGHLYPDGGKSHYTSSVRLANDLQRLALLSGEWSTINSSPARDSKLKDGRIIHGNYPEYRVSRWLTHNLSIDKKKDITIKPYSGMVYCAEVPSFHTLITRRNGKMLISGNCTAHGTLGGFLFDKMKQGESADMLSRLFVYYNTRDIEDTVNSDAGGSVRDAIKSVVDTGACLETDWPYIISKFSNKPTTKCYSKAVANKAIQYSSLSDISSMTNCLSSGYPFVFGFTVYESFESDQVAKTGIVNLPKKNEKVMGGHCVLAVGYIPSSNRFIVRNSWSQNWGMAGCFTMPSDYLANPDLSSDFWVIKTVK